MNTFNHPTESGTRVLATDLDGTLIPLDDRPENSAALAALHKARKEQPFTLIFATGRHYESVIEVMEQKNLPQPDWIVCDVGTSIYHTTGDGFQSFPQYEQHLHKLTGQCGRAEIETSLLEIDNMERQPPDHQQAFKISYECEPEHISDVSRCAQAILDERNIPYHVLSSLDPFANRGLIDVLPRGVTKSYALDWLSNHADFRKEEVVYAGDSGNDLAALTGGFHAVVVANAAEHLARDVQEILSARGDDHLCYCASGHATSGVLEGCIHFGLLTT